MGTTNKSTIAQTIKERRSIKTGYTDQEVKESTVRDLLNDAIWAPTHGMREPWRFIFIHKDQLPTFAKKVAATYKESMQQNREDYLNEPNAILVAIMEEPEMEKQRDENFGAIASFIHNFSLLAWEQDLGVCWKTNPHIYDEAVKDILQVGDHEKIVGFIHLGYFDQAPEKKERTPIDDKLEIYKG